MSRVLADVLVFVLDGMRFALPADLVAERMSVSGERWRRLQRMAETGVLGASGLPLLRLATRLGIAVPASCPSGVLLLVGEGGRVRGTVLVDAEAVRMQAELHPMPESVPETPARQAALVAGIADLSNGERAILLQVPTGIDRAPRPMPVAAPPRALLVAPAGTVRNRVAAVLRGLGHEVSLAEDPRAARLTGRQFGAVLYDLDTFSPSEAQARSGALLLGVSKLRLRAPRGFDALLRPADAGELAAALSAVLAAGAPRSNRAA